MYIQGWMYNNCFWGPLCVMTQLKSNVVLILHFPQLHTLQVAAMVVHPNFQFSPAADRFKAINFLSGVQIEQRYWTNLSLFRFDVAVLKLESPVSRNFQSKMWKNIILDITRWLTRLTLLRYVCHKLEETQRCHNDTQEHFIHHRSHYRHIDNPHRPHHDPPHQPGTVAYAAGWGAIIPDDQLGPLAFLIPKAQKRPTVLQVGSGFLIARDLCHKDYN